MPDTIKIDWSLRTDGTVDRLSLVIEHLTAVLGDPLWASLKSGSLYLLLMKMREIRTECLHWKYFITNRTDLFIRSVAEGGHLCTHITADLRRVILSYRNQDIVLRRESPDDVSLMELLEGFMVYLDQLDTLSAKLTQGVTLSECV